jgi:hypothetical protein
MLLEWFLHEQEMMLCASLAVHPGNTSGLQNGWLPAHHWGCVLYMNVVQELEKVGAARPIKQA